MRVQARLLRGWRVRQQAAGHERQVRLADCRVLRGCRKGKVDRPEDDHSYGHVLVSHPVCPVVGEGAGSRVVYVATLPGAVGHPEVGGHVCLTGIMPLEDLAIEQ